MAVVVAFAVWVVLVFAGVGSVAEVMGVECYDSPCFVSAPERVLLVTWAVALVPAVISGALVVVLWKRRSVAGD